jgi:hypothetical protein
MLFDDSIPQQWTYREVEILAATSAATVVLVEVNGVRDFRIIRALKMPCEPVVRDEFEDTARTSVILSDFV